MSLISIDPPRSCQLEGQRRLSAWIQLAAVLAFAALASPFFLGRVYVADDLGQFHLPLRNFYARQLAAGERFDWMPSLYGGFYVTGEGQLGAYHPLHLLLYRWLPLGAAFDVELLASYPFLFVGMFFFLKRMIGRPDAASLGALTFTFCGFNLLHFVHPNAIAIVAHVPWLLLAIDVALSPGGPRPRAAADLAIGLLTASQLLLGYPQCVWFSLLLESAFAAWRAVVLRATLQSIVLLLLAKLSGAIGGAVQLLPTFDALSDSVRRVPDAALTNSGALHPLNLVQLVAPYLFRTRVVGQNTHELGLYCGAVPLLLCVWLWTQRRRLGRLRSPARTALILGVVGLLLAMGEFGGLYRLQSLVPLANRFRFPCRAIVLVQFSVASAAAMALGLLVQHASAADVRRPTRVLLAVSLASVAVAIVGPLAWPQYVANPLLVWLGPTLIGIAAGLIALAEHGKPIATVALVFFAAADLSAYGLSYSVYGRTADLHEFVAGIAMPPSQVEGRIAAATDARGLRVGDAMLLAGLQRIDGYAGLEPAKRLDYANLAALQLGGAAWIFNPDQGVRRDSPWTRVSPTAPRARMVARSARPESNRVAAPGSPLAAAIGHTERQRDEREAPADLEVAVVDEAVELPAAAPGSAIVIADRPGKITVNTDAPSRQLLVTTESYHRGWRADVDGQPWPVIRVNGDFLGCVVEGGAHRVRLRFEPRGVRLGATLSVCGLALMLCVYVVRSRSRQHTKG